VSRGRGFAASLGPSIRQWELVHATQGATHGPEVGGDGLAHILQCRFNRLTLRHAARELRHVSDVAVVFRVEDQVHKELAGLSHARILQQMGRHELRICPFLGN